MKEEALPGICVLLCEIGVLPVSGGVPDVGGPDRAHRGGWAFSPGCPGQLAGAESRGQL